MLAIRLQRIGKKNRPSYRVVVSESSRDLYGKHNEILGNYDPVAIPKAVNLKAERIKHWMSVGAKPSATVHNLLVSQGIVEGKKIKAWKPKKKQQPYSPAAQTEKKPEAAPKAAPEAREAAKSAEQTDAKKID